MFWLARLIRLVRPMPPTPTPATFSVSLGGVNPRPRTCLGTIAHAALPAATLVRNVRREMSFFLLMIISPRQAALSRAPVPFVKGGFAPGATGEFGRVPRDSLSPRVSAIRTRAGAGWRRRTRAPEPCRRDLEYLLRRAGRSGLCREEHGAAERILAADFSDRAPSPNVLRRLPRTRRAM